VNLNEKNVAIERLLFDPNNYRYQDTADFVYAEPDRFHEESVQERAFKTLRSNASIDQLKASILRNGFIPVERLVVRPYPNSEMFVILEGNRRLAALKWIDQDQKAGMNVPASIKETLSNVPVIVVEGGDELTYKALMGIRHVSGINQWKGYQRAKLITELRQNFGLESAEVAERLGLTAHEVNRRFRAFNALTQMERSEDFGEFTNPDMYPIFHEAVSLTAVKDWIGWDETSSAFILGENLSLFYSLLVPIEDDEGQVKEPKITTYHQVRELRSILGNAEARTLLFDQARSFLEALSVAKREEAAKSWSSSVAAAIGALQSLGVFELIGLDADEKAEIEKLRDLANQILSSYDKLRK